MKGDTGVKLQYTHCRLVSLERNCGAVLASECDPNLLQEEVVDDLVVLIAKFEEVILKSHEEMEPCILTVYLFHLRYVQASLNFAYKCSVKTCNFLLSSLLLHSHTINKAFKMLKVKNESADVASQRLLLFHVAKNILAQGMKLLGLMPLEEM